MRSWGWFWGLVFACVCTSLLLGATAAQPEHSAGQSSVAVYLVRGEKVAPVRRQVPRTSALVRASLAALMRGPAPAERRSGYSTAVPFGTLLRGVALAHGLLTVDLSNRYQSGGGSLSMQLRVAQVVFTATQFAPVKRVVFRLDGRPVEAIGGEGVMVEPPVGRSAFEAQTPPIQVEQPLPGDVVRTPLLVRGSANVFEAQLGIDVQLPGGKLLVHRTVHASAGSGTRGTFRVRISLPARSGKVVLVAYSHSAKNGARINTMRVPVTIGA